MANLQTPPHAIFHQIQANLRDRCNPGFPVVKELIQNAEDAKARIIRFTAQPGALCTFGRFQNDDPTIIEPIEWPTAVA